MTTKTNTERALPFAAAATLAVLLMALVVSPLGAQGGGFNSCTACINWVATSPNSPCYGLSNSPPWYNSPYNQCKNYYTPAYCSMSTSPFAVNGKAPCDAGGSQYPDCESQLCNQYPELENHDVGICSNDCFGKACVDNTGPTCKNIAILTPPCTGEGGSHQCTKCGCAN